MKNKTHK